MILYVYRSWNTMEETSISRKKPSPIFLARAFSTPYTRLEDVQRQQNFISRFTEEPRLQELRELFKL